MAYYTSITALFLLHLSSVGRGEHSFSFSPVIIIPGDAASPLDAKITGPNDCEKRKDWYRLWLNSEEIALGHFWCDSKNMQLTFDPLTNRSHSRNGVEVRVPGWGTTRVIEYVDDSYFARIFHIAYDAVYLVKALMSWGYKRDVSIRGAPYDFRYAMNSIPEWFDRLKSLVKETYHANNNRRVSFISHSMGGLFTTWFLNHQPQEWKDKYIHAFIALSTPWGGSTKALHSITSGCNFDVPFVKSVTARSLQRTMESNYLMMPDYRFQEEGHVFIETPARNFTLSPEDIDDYFRLSNNEVGRKIYYKVLDENKINPRNGGKSNSIHPMVKTYCIFGAGLKTPGKFIYDGNDFPDGQPSIVHTGGDLTLVSESLRGCEEWERAWKLSDHTDNRTYTESHELQGVSHLGVFSHTASLARIKKILTMN